MKVRPSALIIQGGAVLTMRYRYGCDDLYVLPGGNPDRGESLTDALARELKEELGIEAIIGQMVLAGEVLDFQTNEDTLHCVFLTEMKGNTPELNREETTAEAIEWIRAEDLPSLSSLYPNFAAQLPAVVQFPERRFSYTGPLQQLYVG